MNSASEPNERQLLDERLAGLITPAGHDHLRALLGEGDGSGAPDAGECAGDQHNLRAHLMILCWAAGNPTTFVRVTASSRDDHRQRRSISIIETKVAAGSSPH